MGSHLRPAVAGAALIALVLAMAPQGEAADAVPPPGTAPAAGDTPELPAALALLPRADIVPGWVPDGEASHFPAEELWRQINGAADQFLAYGCQSLTVGYYRAQASVASGGAGDAAGEVDEAGEGDVAGTMDAEIVVEIYQMADERGSFGIYALERPPEEPFLAIGAQGYQTGADLNFFGGHYYIKLSAYPDGDVERTGVLQLAEQIAETHLAGSGFPPELDYFPREHLVAGSLGLLPRSVLGLAELNNAFVATYELADFRATDGAGTTNATQSLRLYFIVERDPCVAGAIFHKAVESLAKRATGPIEEIVVGGATGVRGGVKYRGPVMLLRQRDSIILASGEIGQEWSNRIVANLLANLTS